MIHFLAGMSAMFIIAALREEWIRACRIAEYRNRTSQRKGYVTLYTIPNSDLPNNPEHPEEPPREYPPLYRIK